MTEEEKIGRSDRMTGFTEALKIIAPNKTAVESWKKGGCPLVFSQLGEDKGAIATKSQCGINP